MLDFMRQATASSIATGKQWLQFVVIFTLIVKYSWTSQANVPDDLEFSLMLESVF